MMLTSKNVEERQHSYALWCEAGAVSLISSGFPELAPEPEHLYNLNLDPN